MSFKPGAKVQGGLKPTLIGLFSGAMFALSAVGYRGAILSLDLPGFVIAATHTPGAYEDVVRLVVPELQRRGLFRDRYTGSTLRETLGLPRPEVGASVS